MCSGQTQVVRGALFNFWLESACSTFIGREHLSHQQASTGQVLIDVAREKESKGTAVTGTDSVSTVRSTEGVTWILNCWAQPRNLLWDGCVFTWSTSSRSRRNVLLGKLDDKKNRLLQQTTQLVLTQKKTHNTGVSGIVSSKFPLE